LVKKLTERISKKNIYVKVVDVTNLPNLKNDSWSSIVFINTIEWYDLQKNVKAFINSINNNSIIIMFATSGDGNMKPKDSKIDTITSASDINNVDEKLNIILSKLEQILKVKF